MTQQALRSDFDLLLYAKTVRARSGRGLGIAAIAAFFITCAIIDAFASTSALAFSGWPSRAVKIVVPSPGGTENDVAARNKPEARHGAGPAGRCRKQNNQRFLPARAVNIAKRPSDSAALEREFWGQRQTAQIADLLGQEAG